MNAFLPSIHFKRLVGEACLYYREEDVDHTICIISPYVEDILVTGNTLAIVQRVKNQLNNQYDMKDLGVLRHLLGCEIKHELHSSISYLTQYQYTKKAIEKFFRNDFKSCVTPFKICSISLGLKYGSIDRSTEFTDQFESLRNLDYRKSVIYKSLHQRTINDVVHSQIKVDSDLARCINTILDFL